MKDKNKKVRDFFFNNIPLKLLALVLAIFTVIITSI